MLRSQKRPKGGGRQWRRRLGTGLRYALIAAMVFCIVFPEMLFTPLSDANKSLEELEVKSPGGLGRRGQGQREQLRGGGSRSKSGSGSSGASGAAAGRSRQQQQQGRGGDSSREDRPQGLFQIAAAERAANEASKREAAGSEAPSTDNDPSSTASPSAAKPRRRRNGTGRDKDAEQGGGLDDDDGAGAGRPRKKQQPHQHRSRPASSRPSGSNGSGKGAKDPQLPGPVVRGSYKGEREWQIGELDRIEAMWGENLQDNIMAVESEVAGQKKAHQMALQLEGDSILGINGRVQEAVDESSASIGSGLKRFMGSAVSAVAAKGSRGRGDDDPQDADGAIIRDNFHDSKTVTRGKASGSKNRIPPGKEKDWGWRCSHLNECDEWQKEHEKYNKILSGMEKKKGPSTKELAERNAGLRSWGASAARAVAAGEEESCPPIPENTEASSVVTKAVRECAKFLLAQRYRFLNIEEAAIRSEVSALMGVGMNDSIIRAIRQELKHVVRGPVEIINQGFERQQAGEEVNPPPMADQKLAVIKKLSKREKEKYAQEEDAAYLAEQQAKAEVQRQIVIRSWGESKLAKTISRDLWVMLDGIPGLRYRLAGPLAPGGKVHRPGTVMGELASEEWKASSEALPLALNLGLFLGPGQDLQQFKPAELSSVISIERQGSVGTVVHEYKFKPAMLELLPQKDRAWVYGNCAVVGSSGMLLKGERYGAAIDAADAVIRVNMAPTRKYEKYVGTRTTFDVVSTKHAQLLLDGKEKSTRLINSTMVLFESTSPFARESLYLDVMRRFSGMDLKRSHVLVLSPHFVSTVMQTWGQMRNSFESLMHEVNITHTLYARPDSGFYAVMFALQVCRHVDLYGMSNWRPGSDLRYHYFSDETMTGGNKADPKQNVKEAGGKSRSFDFTREVLRVMSVWPGSDTRGALTLHKS